MKLKGLAVGLAAVVTATCLAACGGGNSGTNAGDITDGSGSKETAGTENPKGTEGPKETEVSKTGPETTIKFGIHVADPEHQESVTYKIVQAFNENIRDSIR